MCILANYTEAHPRSGDGCRADPLRLFKYLRTRQQSVAENGFQGE